MVQSLIVKTLSAAVVLAGILTFAAADAHAAKCLYVSSYHQGYAWSDGVERGVRQVLRGRCDFRQFDMDTKRKKSEAEKRTAALAAKRIIETWKPDVVIAADDNAAKYLIMEYYKDAELPFVFCGVNWTAEGYGFPYSNVTGMIEVAPIEPMFQYARAVEPTLKRAYYIGADTLTEEKNLRRVAKVAKRLGIELRSKLVATADDWIAAYRDAQDYGVIVLGSYAGIRNWDDARINAAVKAHARRLSVTNHSWMVRHAMIGITKVPEEQGEWAAKSALRILGGMSASEIPIVANSRREIWINPGNVAAAGLHLPSELVVKAKRMSAIEPKR